MLATPIIGFVVGAGGYLAAQVFADTYTGKMPGPKSFGYFIGTITAATALGLAFMGRKQGYLAEEVSFLKFLRENQPKPPKQDLSKVDLTGYHFKGRPIKRAEEYVAQLSVPEQKIIEHRLRKALENDYSGAELEELIEQGLGSRVSDLSDTINISDFAAESINSNDITEMIEKLSGLGYQWCELCGFHYDDENYHRQEQCSYPEYVVSPASDVDSMRDTLVELGYNFSSETGRCANCNSAAKITAYDLPVGPRNFCSERCYCMYSGLPVMEPGYYGMEAEQKLSKTECCCGATIDNPCECMLSSEPMQCSAKEPKCPCYAAKYDAEETTFIGHIPDWELQTMYERGKITLGQLRFGIGWKKLHENRKRVRTMSGRPYDKTLRQIKRDRNITPEEARERKEIRAEEKISQHHVWINDNPKRYSFYRCGCGEKLSYVDDKNYFKCFDCGAIWDGEKYLGLDEVWNYCKNCGVGFDEWNGEESCTMNAEKRDCGCSTTCECRN